MAKPPPKPHLMTKSLVLYCLIVDHSRTDGQTRFLAVDKNGVPAFPPTKFRPHENLYGALERILIGDLGLLANNGFPEIELPAIPRADNSPDYQGLDAQWYLYPVVVSLDQTARHHLQNQDEGMYWWTLKEVRKNCLEPNVQAIVDYLQSQTVVAIDKMPEIPTMDALAGQWAKNTDLGMRVIRHDDIRTILQSGERAFNLRVADPYLPYQKQGLGFTWSFFTPKDKQDVHVHGLPAVEIYGVLEGQLQIWYKPLSERGVRTWQCHTLHRGDWAEVEPLMCHFACWTNPAGVGTVIKAAGSGELAGVGRLGVSGKTTCKDCNMAGQCQIPPEMQTLLNEYTKPYDQRDYGLIRATTSQTLD